MVFLALSEQTRRDLLDLLRAGPMRVNEMAGQFDVTRSAISQHLRVLRDADLVRETKIGRERLYRLHAVALLQVKGWVEQYEQFWTERHERLAAALEAEAARERSAK